MAKFLVYERSLGSPKFLRNSAWLPSHLERHLGFWSPKNPVDATRQALTPFHVILSGSFIQQKLGSRLRSCGLPSTRAYVRQQPRGPTRAARTTFPSDSCPTASVFHHTSLTPLPQTPHSPLRIDIKTPLDPIPRPGNYKQC